MIRTLKLCLLLTATLATPAAAMVGGAREDAALGRAIVTIVGSRGNFCSGTLIAPDLVLSAAHCVGPGADYKIVHTDAQRQPQLRDVRRIAAHPQFDIKAIQAHRASADVALLQLAAPLPGKSPLPLGAPNDPLSAGQSFTVAGIGVALRGDGRSGGTVRSAALSATGRPGRLQIRLVDAATNNTRDGQGACTGDSGGPALQQQDGRAIVVGVVSWSTGANNAAGCGGLTGITPLTLYRDWIDRTAQAWGSALAK
ncbi:trypsin-like serine protease [Rhodopseudomonas sp. HC1]|uniref:S1 family peptidase n=1 Tax=Rhodopseudomonas infernalis TaxID=2897386 RepID=UPI001EE84EA1|nr:trypsin-like serine protease [Rhodopseudomonas infernalis]MCG6203156.1 trypsin-like serine protease [Rhodopseudomonas infernalis]